MATAANTNETQAREIEPADVLRHYPKGLDYQGRYPEAGHAASEYTDDEPPRAPFDAECVAAWLGGTVIGAICVAAAWHGVAAFLLWLRT